MGITDRMRPEIGAGGFARDDEAIGFFTRVRALVSPGMTVVDLGAGRGSRYDDAESFHARFCSLHGEVARLVGIDVDRAVLANTHLDEAHVVAPDAPWPMASNSVDIVVSEYVLEHIEHPHRFAAELDRVLRPGGWLCALTPNRFGYVGIGNGLVPDRLKDALMRRLWPGRRADDAFATHYRLNTLAALARVFPEGEGWGHHSFAVAATPKYHGETAFLFRAVAAVQRLAPEAVQTNLMVFVRKGGAERPTADAPALAPRVRDLADDGVAVEG